MTIMHLKFEYVFFLFEDSCQVMIIQDHQGLLIEAEYYTEVR